MITVGVLAIQGAFQKHIEALKTLKVNTLEVRYPEDLKRCKGLIIPGGESTRIWRGLQKAKMIDALKEFSKGHPIFGTCAGLILISQRILNDPMEPLGLIDVDIERNAFGRQADSFSCKIQLSSDSKPFLAYFIRAPRIRSYTSNVEVLSFFKDEPVLVRQGHHLGATFHPELTDDSRIHQYFIQLIDSQVILS